MLARSPLRRQATGRAAPTMARPEDLIYAVDELPRWPRLVFLGAQHAVLMSIYLVLIVIVFPSTDCRQRA